MNSRRRAPFASCHKTTKHVSFPTASARPPHRPFLAVSPVDMLHPAHGFETTAGGALCPAIAAGMQQFVARYALRAYSNNIPKEDGGGSERSK